MQDACKSLSVDSKGTTKTMAKRILQIPGLFVSFLTNCRWFSRDPSLAPMLNPNLPDNQPTAALRKKGADKASAAAAFESHVAIQVTKYVVLFV